MAAGLMEQLAEVRFLLRLNTWLLVVDAAGIALLIGKVFGLH
jgi:hypothetical protein